MSPTVRRRIVPILAFIATASIARAQDPEPREGDKVDYHVVAAGETLESITQRYLGTSILWRENWRLNPGVADPHKLWPGQRIRIIVERKLARREAALTRVEKRVEKKPDPQVWTRAAVGDRLLERDGLRTFEESSAELIFDDGYKLELGEESIVFLREFQKKLQGVNRQAIELVQGQADLAMQRRPAKGSDVEIVMADARAKPQVAEAGSLHARARVATGGTAQVMIFDGATAVEAAGGRVLVPRGMGTSVPKGAPPRPPESLLPAPVLSKPAAGSTYSYANPVFDWAPVSGARRYVIEVFADEAATRLVKSRPVTATRWEADQLPAANLYWRVSAVAASGLDGYASPLAAFTVKDPRPDLKPPVVGPKFKGGGLLIGRGGIALAPDGGLLIGVEDDVSGAATIRYRWNDEPWRVWDGKPLVPAESGSTIEAIAVDHRGRESAPWTARVEVHRDVR